MRKSYLSIPFILFILLLGSSCSTENKDTTISKADERPNVIVVLVDDMGYSDIGCYGSSIQTPNLDMMAQNGVRFTSFYNGARCCPSRAALLTGMYPHQVGMGCMVDWPKNAPKGPYQGYLSEDIPTIAEVFKNRGYNTYMAGKWHVGEEQEHWPTKRGFDKYFGLISGASSYFELIKNQPRVRKMAHDGEEWTPPADNFYMTSAFTDSAVSYIKNDDDKPFMMYLAYTAPHWPIHALEEDIAIYEGKYMMGWDKMAKEKFERMKALGIIGHETILPQKPSSIPDWSELSEEEKIYWDRLMAVYAAMIHRVDIGLGDIITTLKEKREYDNTIFMFLSDNGATHFDVRSRGLNDTTVALGAKGSYVSYREPWAWFSNIPYKKFKSSSYWGGMRTSCILSYPKLTKGKNIISDEKGFITDILPTMAALSGNTQLETEGRDISGVISGKEVEEATHYMEHMGSKAVIAGDWKLLQYKQNKTWELYNLKEDPFETNDIIGSQPQLEDSLKALYHNWEERTNSYPIPDSLMVD